MEVLCNSIFEVRLREESRLCVEDTARARFAAFRTVQPALAAISKEVGGRGGGCAHQSGEYHCAAGWEASSAGGLLSGERGAVRVACRHFVQQQACRLSPILWSPGWPPVSRWSAALLQLGQQRRSVESNHVCLSHIYMASFIVFLRHYFTLY